MTFHAAVFIATSLDGFIARPDGSIDWLTDPAEKPGDTGYQEFMAVIDTVVLGRKTYETVLGFDFWPYEGKQVEVLSSTLPAEADERIIVHRTLDGLVQTLNDRGAKRVYADGGGVIRTFLRAGLLNELTITTVPVLIGSGIRLFGELDHDIHLTHNATRTLNGGFTQSDYTVRLR
ncbi:dihydrofolate reductase [Kribbella voronezhensis]|uniref:Dihydrofolate reductase n=1 Tax=Kribbella voronezhensis TaxID=2512212 RepID=A0A4R7TEM7_9ACTN|nr:dihydrofolate reductase family protein [Kribbella voronezhensis]TDU90651.1 dihydrofolate reductase [Kribbella voronezhensis]